jgi:hypothetical protein
LDGQCAEAGIHDMHWGRENMIPAVRPSESPYALASAQLFSCEDGAPETQPRLSVSYGPFDGDLNLHELDQHIAGLRDFLAGLEKQVAQLAAAQRKWEAQQ